MDIPNAVEITNLLTQHQTEAFMATTAVFAGVSAALVLALRKCRARIVYRPVTDNEIVDDLGDPKLRKQLKDQHEKERKELAEGILALLTSTNWPLVRRRAWAKCIGHKMAMPELLPRNKETSIPPNPEKVKARLKNSRADRKAAPLVDKKENALAAMMH